MWKAAFHSALQKKGDRNYTRQGNKIYEIRLEDAILSFGDCLISQPT